MPDITMCKSNLCSMFNTCYRAQAEPSYMQAYSYFEFEVNFLSDKCEYFIPLIDKCPHCGEGLIGTESTCPDC